jgi:SAM-dependent methyltransferase
MFDSLLGAPRRALLADLRGDVLEVGCGDGDTFRHYAAASSVIALDLQPGVLPASLVAARRAPATVRVIAGVAERLPFATDSFDAYVASLVLCSVSDPWAALAEAHRVLRPGGVLRMIEHVRSERRVGALVQESLNPIWHAVNGAGCNLNRRTVDTVESSGFRIEQVRAIRVPFPFGYVVPLLAIEAITQSRGP